MRDAGANLLELGRRVGVVRKINGLRQESFVCVDAVEVRTSDLTLPAWHS